MKIKLPLTPPTLTPRRKKIITLRNCLPLSANCMGDESIVYEIFSSIVVIIIVEIY